MINTNLLLSLGACYRKVEAGDYIFKEGNHCNFYHQVEEGKIKLVNIDDSGKEFLQDIAESGDCIGEIPLFNNGSYVVSAVAISDSIVLRLSKDRFEQLLKEDHELNVMFFKAMADRLQFKMQILKEISSHDPQHCVSSLLQYLASSKKCYCDKCSLVKLTRQQIADMTGLRVETVIRTIRAMQEKGYVAIEKGKVYFNNMRPVINDRCMSS
ncbi:Crp/Fnr family transcriptional regulator [Pinibacter aurantiacus]|uniref:Crp/Fnr family transcriptional regulator n=1 Tax=Pinibacter aurantiacus TaxID=2851599 RepID=A0A9E2W7I6_9BACT|nr:Crp/Fnr family transcriptional regulator [Pinibacter aurantiacus]MBV4356342.1 Crp/Fnr family transcriptional regulator [Pinibacter aurantiacus]